MMRRFHRAATAAAVCLVVSVTTVPAQEPAAPAREPKPLSEVLNPDWANVPLWDDGKAEIATYEATRVVYGAARPYTERLITVSEDFNREVYAKADWPYGDKPLLRVLKQNRVATIPTPNYDYHYMSSLFVERERFPKPARLTVTSQEWCGTTAKTYELWRDTPVMRFMSYWDGEGSGERSLDAPTTTDGAALFEEALPLALRALRFEEGLAARFQLYDNQTTPKAPKPTAASAILRVSRIAKERMAVPAGYYSADQLWEVNVDAADGRSIRMVFEAAAPNSMMYLKHSDGRLMVLAGVTRRAYWELPGEK